MDSCVRLWSTRLSDREPSGPRPPHSRKMLIFVTGARDRCWFSTTDVRDPNSSCSNHRVGHSEPLGEPLNPSWGQGPRDLLAGGSDDSHGAATIPLRCHIDVPWTALTPTSCGRASVSDRCIAHSNPPAVLQGAHIESRMSRCVWFGGQDWVGPHRFGGQARIRSHHAESVGGWEPTGHYEDSTIGVRQPVIGSGSHPDRYAVRGKCLNVSLAT